MGITLTFFGHAGYLLTAGKHAVAIDPFLTGNPVATMKPQDVACQAIVLTHGHGDHLGDTAAIAKANKATVYAANEIAEYLGGQGVTCEPGNPSTCRNCACACAMPYDVPVARTIRLPDCLAKNSPPTVSV